MKAICRYVGTAALIPVMLPAAVAGFIIGLAVACFRAGWGSVEDVASWMRQ